ncbi:MAG: hypothetical protein A2017_03595 [Lentisphaerae bacterium GWF2_44_16]|nr:MAG: hypothetical protein A2017_03595 [Lentisphaerae bacterium GWF2_44_16]
MDEVFVTKKLEIVRRPPGMPFHWVYFILYGLAMCAALWQHGHAIFTIVMLALVIPSGFILYIPYSILNQKLRNYIQISVLVSAAVWGAYRCMQNVPLDKVLIETICVMGLSFAFTSRPADYGYQFLISVLLLVYGALIPRGIYLCIFPFALILGMFLLYHSRIIALAGDCRLQIPPGIFRYNWRHILLHVLITLLFLTGIYSVLPITPRQGKGIIEVSFRNENENFISPDFNKWMKSKDVKRSDKAKILLPGMKSPVNSNSGPPVSSKEPTKNMSPSGNGAGLPGEEIIFRVKSPVKLYWLGQLYDSYDGLNWTATERMKKQEQCWSTEMWKLCKSVEQRFIVEKWLSPVLYSAYEASYYNLGFGFREKTKKNFYQERFMETSNFPELPFTYTVSSNIPYPEGDGKKGRSFWFEKLKPAYYLQLPKNKISARVRKLAKEITVNSSDNYAKALALRDYLRNNYTYQMLAKPTPPGKEAVDYFLFVLKEGHCEYFASALTVLARLNGLPARVATGFSPGNYNVLNGLFEVHEYHAHAWTQIFIEGKGWLTFDAVPPGQIISRTTPLGIGKLHDPFGDEWRVTPPEMTSSTQDFIKPEEENENLENKKSGLVKAPEMPLPYRVFMNIIMAPEEFGQAVDRFKERFFPDKKDDISFKDILGALSRNFHEMLKRISGGMRSFAVWIFSMDGLSTLLLVLPLSVLAYLSPLVFRAVNRRIRIRKCMKWYEQAMKNSQINPPLAIRLAYRTARELLNLGGWPRKNNMELFEYGASLKGVDTLLCKDVLVIYFIYTQMVYSAVKPSVENSKAAVERISRIRVFVMNKIKHHI